jgi:hypothetical protein
VVHVPVTVIEGINHRDAECPAKTADARKLWLGLPVLLLRLEVLVFSLRYLRFLLLKGQTESGVHGSLFPVVEVLSLGFNGP